MPPAPRFLPHCSQIRDQNVEQKFVSIIEAYANPSATDLLNAYYYKIDVHNNFAREAVSCVCAKIVGRNVLINTTQRKWYT